MLKLLKSLLGIQDHEDVVEMKSEVSPVQEKPSSLETRVRHYHNTSYIAEYRKGWTWYSFYNPLTLYADIGRLRDDHRSHPKLGSFDECVTFCKKFKTIDDVDAYHQSRFAHWDALYEAQESKKRELEKFSWSSSDG